MQSNKLPTYLNAIPNTTVTPKHDQKFLHSCFDVLKLNEVTKSDKNLWWGYYACIKQRSEKPNNKSPFFASLIVSILTLLFFSSLLCTLSLLGMLKHCGVQ